jgi:hypothetical protein
MKLKKALGWSVLGLLFGLMLIAGVVFLLASSVPGEYQPYNLTQEDRQQQAQHLVKHQIAPFWNNFGKPEPFTHAISEDQLNLYLASLDEIAYNRPNRADQTMKTGGVYEAMDKAGLADPVVKMSDGMLTVMVRTKASNKVISMDLVFDIVEGDRLKVGLDEVRIGRMPVPQFMLAEALDSLKSDMAEKGKEKVSLTSGLEMLLATVVGAICEDPIPTKLKIRKQTKQTHRVEITDGQLKIHIVPTPGTLRVKAVKSEDDEPEVDEE